MTRSREPDETEDAREDSDPEFRALLRAAAHVSGDAPLPILPHVGQLIDGKYRIIEVIGRGGMGVVFRAAHVVSEKPVALKWMLRPASDDYGYRRFVREALAAGRIDHPNVVDVYDVGQDSGGAYLVMELLHGESLRVRLQRGALEVGEALRLLLPAMRGVAAVHHSGVIHRDLKPDNVFLCEGRDGTPREAKVLDFGISAVVENPSTADPTLTKDGALLGTPTYMSPEQLVTPRGVDARSDVYSFGVILYEALTGQPPFKAESYPGLVLAISTQVAKHPSALRREVPSALGRVVLRALAKRPAERWDSMDSFIAALEPFASAIPNASRRSPGIKLALSLALFALIAVASWLRGSRGDTTSLSAATRTPTDGTPPSSGTGLDTPECMRCTEAQCASEIADCTREDGCQAWFADMRDHRKPLLEDDDLWRRFAETRWASAHGEANWASAFDLTDCSYVRCRSACNSGRHFDCVGRFDYRATVESRIELRYHFLEDATNAGIDGLRVRACATGTRCERPLAEATTSGGGFAKLDVDFKRATGLRDVMRAFTGYVLVDGHPGYTPLQTHYSQPLPDHEYTAIFMDARESAADTWRSRNLPPLGPERRLLQVQPRDCNLWGALDVTLEIWRPDATGYHLCTDCLIAYPDHAGEPDTALRQFTSLSGAAAWVGLSPGIIMLAIRDVSSQKLLSVLRPIDIRADYETLVIIYPASTEQLAGLPDAVLHPPRTH